MIQKNKSELKDWYYRQFKQFENGLNGQSATPWHSLRKQAMEKFLESGFPTNKDEEWRYTNISPLLKVNFTPAVLNRNLKVERAELEKYLIKNLQVNLLVFINGSFKEKFSSILPQAGNIEVIDYASNQSEFIEQSLVLSNVSENGFSALNTAFSLDGAIIKIPENSVIEDPVHLLFLSGDKENNLLIQPRNIIIVGKNSQLKVIESYHSLYANPYLLNGVTNIVIEENSNLDYYKIQNEADTSFHVNRTQVLEKRSGTFNSYAVSLGGEIIRNDLNTVLGDENSECHYFGLYLASDKMMIDNHTLIDHAKPHCHSNELYKGILDGNSRGVFNGKVIVRKDAQKTLAYQSNKNLLLSREARVNTKPQLEIFADDVKCSHGATVGQLNEESLFYLQSRGINKDKARSILIKAFASDILDLIKIEQLKEQLSDQILKKLNQVSIL
jgi:Fe-S cluster assembly protein SufD